MPAERLGRVKAPAGLDLGAVTPVEIAISILAEIVQHHRSDKAVEPPPAATTEVTEATDPICGMSVEIATARHRSELAGRTTYFCCLHCKETFDRNPERYLASGA